MCNRRLTVPSDAKSIIRCFPSVVLLLTMEAECKPAPPARFHRGDDDALCNPLRWVGIRREVLQRHRVAVGGDGLREALQRRRVVRYLDRQDLSVPTSAYF